MDDHRFHAGVADDVGRLVDGVVPVHGDGIGTELSGRHARFEEGEVVAHHHADAISGTDADRLEGRRRALDACGEMWVNVEVKNHRTEPDYDADDHRTDAVLDVLRRRVALHGDVRRYLLSCFRRETVDHAAKIWPDLPTAWLTISVPNPDVLARDLKASGHVAVHPEVGQVSRELIDAFHRHGLAVNTWTCDDPANMAVLIDWGIDGICTNVPDVALRVLAKTRPASA